MYYVCKPTKIRIYVNTAKKTAAQIKNELGCDVIINGGLYDGNWKPCCWLKADGKLLHSENWSDWGYGWEINDIAMDTSSHVSRYRNFISCVALIRDGKLITPLTYPPEIGGKRGRSAIGLRASGEVVTFCTQDGTSFALTPEQLQTEMKSLGCVSALMLDGGQSSHCFFPNGFIPAPSSRPFVQNYICMWTKDAQEQPKPECPYDEPTHNIRWGSIGSGAKWVQWQLNRHGAKLDVDGLFFGLSVGALRKFQMGHGLVWDGVCGPLTKEELKK